MGRRGFEAEPPPAEVDKPMNSTPGAGDDQAQSISIIHFTRLLQGRKELRRIVRQGRYARLGRKRSRAGLQEGSKVFGSVSQLQLYLSGGVVFASPESRRSQGRWLKPRPSPRP